MVIATRHTPTNTTRSLGFTTRESMVSEGMEMVVTLIMNASTVPRPTPLRYRASAMGMAPKVSA